MMEALNTKEYWIALFVGALLGIAFGLLLTTISDKWCLYHSAGLLLKNTDIYASIAFGTPLILAPLYRLVSRKLGLKHWDVAVNKALATLSKIGLVILIYFWVFYGSLGFGVCSNPNINVNYFEKPGQKAYITN